MGKIGSAIFILVFGAALIYALLDGNKTGIITTGVTFILVCISQVFNLIPRLRKWNMRK